MGKHKDYRQTGAAKSGSHVPSHGGPQTGNGRTSDTARKPKSVVSQSATGRILGVLFRKKG